MAADAVVRARISAQTKREASVILERVGLTTSDLIRMTLLRIVEDNALPLDLIRPNKVTVRAIDAARAGNVQKAKSARNLLNTLNERD